MLIVHSLFFLVAEFALDNYAYSLCEDEGPQVVFVEPFNSVILATNIEVFVAPQDAISQQVIYITCCEMEFL